MTQGCSYTSNPVWLSIQILGGVLSIRHSFPCLLAIVTFSGCTVDRSAGEIVLDLEVNTSFVGPNCHAGCQGPGEDPHPSDPGEWIGPDFNEDICIGGSSDTDQDGLGDLCEFMLTKAFAPEMVSWSRHDGGTAENIGGEFYWGARVISTGLFAGTVMLAYLPAYYEDLGEPASGLSAHPGDSEIIILYVRYNPATSHWILKASHLSEHTVYGYNGSNLNDIDDYATGEYPGRKGGFPRVWVAKFKHANYGSRMKCLAGGFGGLDVCDTYSYSHKWRYPVVESRNIGSSSVKLNDCEYSDYAPGPEIECLWDTTSRFQGWMYVVDPNHGAGPYGTRLQTFDFLP